jgi:hypothetical protein
MCESGNQEVDLGELSHASMFIPSCPGLTGMTDALDRSDWCKALVGFVLGNFLVHVVLARGAAG